MVTLKGFAVLFCSAIVMGIGIKIGTDLYAYVQSKFHKRLVDRAADQEIRKLVHKETEKLGSSGLTLEQLIPFMDADEIALIAAQMDTKGLDALETIVRMTPGLAVAGGTA